MSLKNRAFSGIGSSLEWFDFSLYGFFAPIFSKIFCNYSPKFKKMKKVLDTVFLQKMYFQNDLATLFQNAF